MEEARLRYFAAWAVQSWCRSMTLTRSPPGCRHLSVRFVMARRLWRPLQPWLVTQEARGRRGLQACWMALPLRRDTPFVSLVEVISNTVSNLKPPSIREIS